MQKITRALLITTLACAAAPALAADAPAPAFALTSNVGLYSQYVFRGIAQSGEKPAIQGGMDLTHTSGFYAGFWGSNVSWLEDYQGYSTGSLELDLYGGYRGGIGDTGISYDVGVLRYQYPGSRPAGIANANTTELYGSLGWKWFALKYSQSVGAETFGFANSRNTNYLDLSAALPVGDTGLTLGAHYGKQKYKGDVSGVSNDQFSYDDWKVSATYDLGKLSAVTANTTVGIAYTDTNADRAVYTDANNKFMGASQTTVWIARTF
jgi:uncharacterized protein (TIGR02001 family)